MDARERAEAIGAELFNGAFMRKQVADAVERAIREAVEAEREACANVCAGGSHDPDDWGAYYADEIRARSKVTP